PAVLIACWDLAPDGHDFGDHQLWQRLIELSGNTPTLARSGASWDDVLIEARFDGQATWGTTHFRIRPLGLRVRDKRTDALKHCRFHRWVGGRLITNDRSIRR